MNVRALKAYAEAIKKALDAKAKEAEALCAECESRIGGQAIAG